MPTRVRRSDRLAHSMREAQDGASRELIARMPGSESMIEQADVVTTPLSSRPPRAGRKRGRGAIAQVFLFLSVWGTIVPTLGLLAAWPTLTEAVGRSGMIGSDGRIAPDVDADQMSALLTASSETTMAVAAATALGTALSVWVMQRFFRGPALLDLGLRRRPNWIADSVIGLALGPIMFLAILLVLLAAGWVSVGPGSIGIGGLLAAFVTYLLVAF